MNQHNSGFMSSIPPVTRNIIIINTLIWLAEVVLRQRGIFIEQYFALFSLNSGYFMPHQLITYMFLHSPFGPAHLFFNMFAVFMFGRILETNWGPKKFLSYYLFTGIGAGLTQLLVYYLTNTEGMVVGASGAVFGILVAFGMLYPNNELFIIPFPFPIKAKWLVIGYGIMELALGLSNNAADNVAHFAHLGGLVTGFFIVLYWQRKDNRHGKFH